MRKALVKRVEITKRGKMLRRKSRVNHFNAKESRKVHRRRGAFLPFEGAWKRKMKQYL